MVNFLGLLYEKTRSTSSTFIFAGICLGLSFIFSLVVSIMETFKYKKLKSNTQSSIDDQTENKNLKE